MIDSERPPECPHARGHQWETVGVGIEGYGSGSTYTVEQCSLCEDLRMNFEPDVIGEVGR